MTSHSTGARGVIDTTEAIASGALTAEEAVRDCLNRIAAQEDQVGAWVHLDADAAIAAAQAQDRGEAPGGALRGVPLGVKDIFAARGLPWRCGSPIWRDRVADFDAGSVALARRAGAVIMGKTETTEFAGYNPARTRNPFDPARTPGGSSSGSAAAVACGMVPLALGTQTSGSIIRPASYCGVVGYKPSFDLIEPGGVAPLARSLDTVGVFARSVADAARAVGALSGHSLRLDPTFAPSDLHLWRTDAWGVAQPDLIAAWEAFEGDLTRHRTSALPVSPALAALLADAPALHARIMAREASEALSHEHAIATDLLSDGLRAQIEDGRAQSPETRARDRAAMHHLRHAFYAEIPRDAVWLTPSATGAAPVLADGTGDPAFNRIWSLLGVPCVSVPLPRGAAGHPIGVQVVGAMGNDTGVLALADWLMRRRPE